MTPRPGISEHQDRFEHELAVLMTQCDETDLTYAEARQILATSKGAGEFAAKEAMYEKNRSWVDRLFRWIGF